MKRALVLGAVVAALAAGSVLVAYAQAGGGGVTPAASNAPAAPIVLTADQEMKLATPKKAYEDALKKLTDQATLVLGDKDGKAYVAQLLTKEAETLNPPAAPTTTATPPAGKAGKAGKSKKGGGGGGG